MDEESTTERPSLADRFREVLPRRSALLTASAFGLLVAWWISFHEIACGCMSIRASVPLAYTYESCYAFGLGTALGALVALILARRGKLPAIEEHGLGAAAIGAGLNLLFTLCTALDWYLVASTAELLLNATATLVVVSFLPLWKPLSRTDSVSCLVLVGAICLISNNGVMPLLVHEGGNVVAVAPVQLALLGGGAFLLRALLRKGKLVLAKFKEWIKGNETATAHELRNQAQEEAAFHFSSRTPDEICQSAPFPWLLAFHLSVYCCLFGIMHVEASTLISPFLDRNVPYACGAAAAVALFCLLFMGRSRSPYLWPKIRNVVFPLTMVSFLLLPYLDTVGSFVPVASINGAVVLYELLVVMGIFAIARESPLPITVAAAWAALIGSLAFFAGSVLCHGLINFVARDVLMQDGSNIAVFALLMAATFWVGDDRRAGKLWGMRINLPPNQMAAIRLRGKCAVLAVTFGLTPRETEILELLAEGQRPPQIAEKLVISVSTARTHVKNLYAKVGAHSQIEVADLVNAVDERDIPPQAQL